VEVHRLACHLGFEGYDPFCMAYNDARRAIRAAYGTFMKKQTGPEVPLGAAEPPVF
jgi:hypothetical protein